MTSRQSRAVLAVALGVATVLLCSGLDAIPGLHGDEAWVGLRAHAIWNGERPVTGMNAYTGPIYEFLMAAWLRLVGYRVFTLRLLTSLTSLLTIVLYHRTTTRLFGPTVAALATLTLVSMPFFTAFGRLAGENFALNPILAVGAILLLLESEDVTPRPHGPAWRRWLLPFFSGVCMGLGTWNHAIFGSVPIAVAAAALQRRGASLLRRASTYTVSAGCLIGLVPLVFIQLRSHLIQLQGHLPADAGHPGTALPQRAASLDLLREFLHGLLNRLTDWPALFFQIAHGDILFRRFAGELALGSPNVVAVLAAVGLAAMWTMRTPDRDAGVETRAMQVTVFSGALFMSTLFICPGNSDRYFLLPLYVVPLLVAMAFVRLWNGSLRGLPGWPLWAFAVFIGSQLARTGVDYFAAQERSHGRVSILMLGRQAETSNHYLRTDGLYRQLVSLGATNVSAEFFIAEPLQFYDLEQRHLSVVSLDDQTVAPTEGQTVSPTDQAPAGSYAVFYSGGLRRNLPGRHGDAELVSEDDRFVVKRYAPRE
jgi:4-amino-4-deoxy-L-arabinose transferase-like glycosyltransferase